MIIILRMECNAFYVTRSSSWTNQLSTT